MIVLLGFSARGDFIMNRFTSLAWSVALTAAVLPLAESSRCLAGQRGYRVLYFTRTVGYEHAVIRRKGHELSLSESVLTGIGKQHSIDVQCSKDGRIFDGDISKYDAFVFFTNGDLTKPNKQDTPPLSPEGKARFLDAIARGKGFVGVHGACGTWRIDGSSPRSSTQPLDPFLEMLGSEFLAHGPIQKATLGIVSSTFPGMQGIGEPSHEDGQGAKLTAQFVDEWYAMENFAPRMHVIMLLYTSGMKGDCYHRRPYPIAWARNYHRGRVFYTALGHTEEMWRNEAFHQMLLGGLNWSLRKVDFDPAENFDLATSGEEFAH